MSYMCLRCLYFCPRGSCKIASQFYRGASVDAQVVFDTKCRGLWYKPKNDTHQVKPDNSKRLDTQPISRIITKHSQVECMSTSVSVVSDSHLDQNSK